ncbi:hypothetical protein ACWIUD_06440 [Helicobacter sp. 23-1044]
MIFANRTQSIYCHKTQNLRFCEFIFISRKSQNLTPKNTKFAESGAVFYSYEILRFAESLQSIPNLSLLDSVFLCDSQNLADCHKNATRLQCLQASLAMMNFFGFLPTP